MATIQSTEQAVAGSDRLSPSALAAWEDSFFSAIAPYIRQEILATAYERDLAPGSTMQVTEPVLAVVAEGLIRVNVKAPAGRQVTIHYLSPCDVMGLPSTIAPARVAAQRLSLTAMRPAKLVHVSPREFRALVAEDGATAFQVCEHIVGDLLVGQSMLAENVFLPVRQRVARHLLDLAEREGRTWVVHATQQDLADAIGSVREVVSRALMQLRDEGLIRRVPEGLAICDTAGLHRESKGYVW
jgi:CRP-like cAMP-binding protein